MPRETSFIKPTIPEKPNPRGEERELEQVKLLEIKERIKRLKQEIQELEDGQNRVAIPEQPSKKEEETRKPRRMSRRNFLSKTALLTAGMFLGSRSIGEQYSPPVKKEKNEPKPEKKLSREEKINNNIEEHKQIIQNEQYEKILENPYLVSALYYSEKAIKKIKLSDKHASEIIISTIYPLITKKFREGYINFLKKLIKEKGENTTSNPTKRSLPLDSINWKEAELNHGDAVDLFIKEGSPIYSITGGVVVLSENNWSREDDMSTGSMLGGNSVIVFNPQDESFYRYAHMEKTNISVGSILSPSDTIGIVGHTGINASKKGHGEHVHIEINKYNKKRGIMVPSYLRELQKKLRAFIK